MEDEQKGSGPKDARWVASWGFLIGDEKIDKYRHI
jgi:hypothetical protein